MSDRAIKMIILTQLVLAMTVFVIATAQFYILRQMLYW